ncbi:MAG: hypothetical protein Q9176_003908 [Flavoplaca citrina]
MVRLLNAESLTLQQFKDEACPPYAILSHRWAEDPSTEVVYDDMAKFEDIRHSSVWKKAKSAAKIVAACQKVLELGFVYLWVDTVCIKQDNPIELSTAINSMYRLYHDAEVCIVYLYDYPTAEVQTLSQSDWFTRGWTLQELVAPQVVKFFDKNWDYIGKTGDLAAELTHRTGVHKKYWTSNAPVNYASVSERMSWMAGRKTTVPEDIAYCMLGLFGVNMPLLYGEGKERAFLRLQEEIMKYSADHSLFAWEDDSHQCCGTGLLAPSPECFRSTGHYRHRSDQRNNRPYQMTNKGIAIDLPLVHLEENDFVGALNCHDEEAKSVGLYLRKVSGNHYCRVRPEKISQLTQAPPRQLQSIYVNEKDPLLIAGMIDRAKDGGQ